MGTFTINPAKKRAIWRRDRTECCYCNKYVPKKQRTLDHVHPQARGGHDGHDNLVLACKSCNSAKGMKTLKQFTDYMVIEGMASYQSALNVHKRVYRRLNTPLDV
jgi:5-methylcytosine-specific restriction endonuclease McrA